MLTIVRSAQRFGARGLMARIAVRTADWKRDIASIEGIQGDVAEFVSIGEAHKILSRAQEYRSQGPSIQGIQGGLYSVMGLNSVSVYGSTPIDGPTQSRDFSTSTPCNQPSSQQGSQLKVYDYEEYIGEPSAQGIQGDNCVHFKLWMENCQKYHLPNCDDQLEAVASGKKTLAQVFTEQESIIREVAETYWNQQPKIEDSVDVQGIQDKTFNIIADTAPCPQGLQGTDCANFKIWAHNCQAFGFDHCEDRLHDVVSGRRSLRDIFDEQEKLIQQIVSEHKQMESKSPSDSP